MRFKHLLKLQPKTILVFFILIGLIAFKSFSQTLDRSHPKKSRFPFNLELLGTYKTGIFDEGAAEISAYDPTSKRLFVSNADQGTIDVLTIEDPSNPEKLFAINIDDLVEGGEVNSVATNGGMLAAAVNIDGELGKVVFIDTDVEQPVQAIKIVTVGSLPDMLTFTNDGLKVLVANEGEPDDDGLIDPEGSISIIDLNSYTVTQVGFEEFNGREYELRNKGIRIFGNNTVSQDLEPEFISISPDGTTAFVTLQENNAFAVLDLASEKIIDLIPLGYKDHSKGQPRLKQFIFQEPALDEAKGIAFGGLSGLFFEGINENGNPTFLTVPDRGPNGNPTPVTFLNNDDESTTVRPFLIPEYQAQVIRFELSKGKVNVLDKIFLTRNDGITPISGLPNIPGIDEVPATPVESEGDVVDEAGNQFKLLGYDEFGADLEGIVINPTDGTYWMVDEYRPAIYHFQPNGILIDRYVPKGTAALASPAQPAGTYGNETLPAAYSNRRRNRGFEAMALDTNQGILYAFIQTPLANPDRSTSDNSQVIRILGIDPSTGEPVAEYVYFLEKPAFRDANVDKIGDAVFDASTNTFYVIERDSRANSTNKKAIFSIDLTGATNIINTSLPATLESYSPDELALQNIHPVHKIKVLNLPSIGYLPSDKPEGLALLPNGALAVLNDNDFGLEGPALSTTALGLINFASKNNNALDASDRDGGINIANWPVYGMYQPDAITSFEIDGSAYYMTANEGDARDYDFFSEEARVKDDEYVLDPAKFPNSEFLKSDAAIGRLGITTENGDLDGDGDYDQIYAYGARSFSIWDKFGNLVFDSGDMIEKIVAEYFPDNFNANNDDNDQDNRSDNKGPEPEGITYAQINGQHYAFVGLERVGGIMAFLINRPSNPQFVTYVNNRDFDADVETEAAGDLGPEGLLFISADDSPNGDPLLVVTNEVSGTTSIYTVGGSTRMSLPTRNNSAAKIAYPNPAFDKLTIKLNASASQKRVIVKNMMNEVLVDRIVEGGVVAQEIDVKQWQQGHYVLEVNDGKSVTKQRILKR